MPELNPYEAPQSELQALPQPSAPRVDVARGIKLLTALQSVLVIAVAICFLLGAEPRTWVWSFLRTLLLGVGMNSVLLASLAWRNRAWIIMLFAILVLGVSGSLLYAMYAVDR